MHISSLTNMIKFVEKYLDKEKKYKILDIGSQEVEGEANGSYRLAFNNSNWEYVGCDIVAGKNVDIVLKEPYKWQNIKRKSFDCVVCGQMLEHDEFFWLTMLEIRRILKPEGLCCIIAPSGGPEHKYPVDCYRYYPDGLKAAAHYAGLEAVEVYAQWNEELYPDWDPDWRDCVLICKRPSAKSIDDLKYAMSRWMINTGSKCVYHIDYGNSYSRETTWTTPKPSLVATLYVDTGEGFNEQQVEKVVLKTNEHFKQHWIVSADSKAIRFEPLQGYGCIIEKLKITLSTGKVDIAELESNGTAINLDSYIFVDTKTHIFLFE